MAPLPPGIRITLPCGAFGLISTAREPPMFTVSSAAAGVKAKAVSSAARLKQLIQKCFVIVFFLKRRGRSDYIEVDTTRPRCSRQLTTLHNGVSGARCCARKCGLARLKCAMVTITVEGLREAVPPT